MEQADDRSWYGGGGGSERGDAIAILFEGILMDDHLLNECHFVDQLQLPLQQHSMMTKETVVRLMLHQRNSSSSATAFEPVDPSSVGLMVPDALADSKSYIILPLERIEEKKREFTVLSSQIKQHHERLKKNWLLLIGVDTIATDLWKVTGKLMEVERIVLKHNAAVLRFSAVQAGAGENGGSGGKDAAAMAAAAKASEEIEIGGKLEGEAVEMQRKLVDKRDAGRKMERSVRDSERAVRRLEDEVKDLRSMALSAHLATLRAENASLQDEANWTQEKLAKVQSQLDEDLSNMEEKDRMISNLLSELEEVTNQLKMRTAANKAMMAASNASPGGTGSSAERQLRVQVAALETQLRELKRSGVTASVASTAAAKDSAS
ncbi:hypothetical protein HDU76_007649, partial [Blyttiomyces sp. JEL0837]